MEKIAFVCRSLTESSNLSYLFKIFEYFLKKGYEISLYAQEVEKDKLNKNVNLILLPKFFNNYLFNEVTIPFQTLKAVKRKNHDLIYSHSSRYLFADIMGVHFLFGVESAKNNSLILKIGEKISFYPKSKINNVVTFNYGKFYCRDFSDFFTVAPIHEREILHHFLNSVSGGIFIDVGAHIGKYSIVLAKKAEKIIAIEPEKRNYEILKRNIDLNGFSNVLAILGACSSKNGYAKLYKNEESSTGHTLECSKNVDTMKFEKVKTYTLDTLCKLYHIEACDVSLIKIDVEGHEIEVLKGGEKLLKTGKPTIIFECLEKERFEEIKNFLISKKYKIVQISSTYYLAFKT